MSVYSIDRLTKSILAERFPRVRLTAYLRLLNLLIEGAFIRRNALTAHFKWPFLCMTALNQGAKSLSQYGILPWCLIKVNTENIGGNQT